MFYRRKILLAILQIFGNELNKIDLQKFLFLYTKDKENPEYEFIPYKFGCFSFSANADLNALVKKEILLDLNSKFKKNDDVNYLETLEELDQKKIKYIKDTYGNMNTRSLMEYTYINYPFWAIKSKKAKEILNKNDYQKVTDAIPNKQETILFTIGYEGISLEEYFIRLIKNDIKVLVDVRRNALSRKYGFSKTSLTNICNSLDIQYMHFPEVGIQSNERQVLNCQNDYDMLFANYKENNLTKTKNIQDKIFDLLIKYKRIALTCYESEICKCHRVPLAEAISLNPNFRYTVEHI